MLAFWAECDIIGTVRIQNRLGGVKMFYEIAALNRRIKADGAAFVAEAEQSYHDMVRAIASLVPHDSLLREFIGDGKFTY